MKSLFRLRSVLERRDIYICPHIFYLLLLFIFFFCFLQANVWLCVTDSHLLLSVNLSISLLLSLFFSLFNYFAFLWCMQWNNITLQRLSLRENLLMLATLWHDGTSLRIKMDWKYTGHELCLLCVRWSYKRHSVVSDVICVTSCTWRTLCCTWRICLVSVFKVI